MNIFSFFIFVLGVKKIRPMMTVLLARTVEKSEILYTLIESMGFV